ncbi:MAG: ABC transporter ATP-binding protein [Oligosphaeraceae bacterium]|mgnify:CR=1 FL=1|nr:ABC transporter ATP-binding protein [Oligosphaeraceae bacterium]
MVKEPALLEVRDLSVAFDTEDGILKAVNHVSFSLRAGQVLGLVGESGCGKSVSAMSIARLIPQPPGRISSGEIYFQGRDILKLSIAELRKIRGRDIAMIFQEPMTALSPLHRIEKQLAEVFQIHTQCGEDEIRQRSLEMLAKVGIADPELCLRSYPYELSGGMRQRVMIAMALLLEPALLIADEPTTALDVTIQAQILDLLKDLMTRDSALLLITHDMGVVWQVCDHVAVMYASYIVENAPVDELFANPAHPYTQGLLASIPSLQKEGAPLQHIPGQVPSPLNLPEGCPFAPRCPKCIDKCLRQRPELEAKGVDGHLVACWQA